MGPSTRPSPRLHIPPAPMTAVLGLEAELGVSSAVAQVLVRRGWEDPSRARDWLAAADHHPPHGFCGIEEAGAVILRHAGAGAQITVHGDYDVDGVCSTAVMVTALRRLGARVDWYLPDRLADGYGLAGATIERLAGRGTRLLVTVDCGITAVEEVAAARQAGLEVVITDHHAPRGDGRLPAAPIVHPSLCGYPCPDLCATGVAFKLAAHLHEAAGHDPRAVEAELDLVALATVADVVPLRGENRRLVRAGLRALAASGRPGLRALMRVAALDPGAVDARAVGFRLAPRINAAGRLYRADAGLELLLTEDEERAAQVAEELDAANAERRHVETRILFEAEGQVSDAGDRPAYVLAGEGWHRGVIGIVAARIAERHHRPTILLALEEDRADGGPIPSPPRRATGSGRSIPAYDLLSGLEAAGEHLLRYGGHRAAAGLELEVDRVEDFRRAFTAHAAAALTGDDLRPVERVDAVVSGGELGLELAEELEGLAPFGAANPDVCLLLPAATLSDPEPIGEGKHVRFTVQSGGARARAVGFGTGGQLPVSGSGPVDATFVLERHEYRGVVEPRLVLRHAVPCAPAPPRLVGEPESYLEAAWDELDAPLEVRTAGPVGGAERVRDRRGMGIAGTLGALVGTREPVLVVCADARRRRAHLSGRLGGFDVCSYAGLARRPELVESYQHLVALDPPWHPALLPAARTGATSEGAHSRGDGRITYLAWGAPELGFAVRVHDHQYGLRPWLAALYRSLRAVESAEGDRLEAVLKGGGSPGRSPTVAGRVIRVLSELGLVHVDRELSRVTVPTAQRTALERSPAFRAYDRQHQEGQRYLRQMTARAA